MFSRKTSAGGGRMMLVWVPARQAREWQESTEDSMEESIKDENEFLSGCGISFSPDTLQSIDKIEKKKTWSTCS